jgi:hypothetical protein
MSRPPVNPLHLGWARIVVFQASVAGRVPLFTVGAFLTFTFSQAGMLCHWWRKRGPGWHWRMAVNAIGAATTTVVLGVVLVSKFVNGAWIVVLVASTPAQLPRLAAQVGVALPTRHVCAERAVRGARLLQAGASLPVRGRTTRGVGASRLAAPWASIAGGVEHE